MKRSLTQNVRNFGVKCPSLVTCFPQSQLLNKRLMTFKEGSSWLQLLDSDLCVFHSLFSFPMTASLIKCRNSPARGTTYLPYRIVDSAVSKHQTPTTSKPKIYQEDIFNLANPGLPILGKFIAKPKTASSVVVQQLSAMSSPRVSLPAISTPRASNKIKGPGHLFLSQDFYSDSEQLRRQKLAIRNLEFKSGQAMDQVLDSRRRLSLYMD